MGGVDPPEQELIDQDVWLERATSMPGIAAKLAILLNDWAAHGVRPISVSYTVDRADPDGQPYHCLAIGETRRMQ